MISSVDFFAGLSDADEKNGGGPPGGFFLRGGIFHFQGGYLPFETVFFVTRAHVSSRSGTSENSHLPCKTLCTPPILKDLLDGEAAWFVKVSMSGGYAYFNALNTLIIRYGALYEVPNFTLSEILRSPQPIQNSENVELISHGKPFGTNNSRCCSLSQYV